MDLADPPRPRPHRGTVQPPQCRAAGTRDYHVHGCGHHVYRTAPAAEPGVSAQPRTDPRRGRPAAADGLRTRQLLWATVDSPWVHMVDQARYLDSLARVRAMAPERILSTHL